MKRLLLVQWICLALAALAGGITLAAWMSPRIGYGLPPVWMLMKSLTALSVLLSAASLALSQSKRFPALVRISQGLAVLVLLLSLLSLLQRLLHAEWGMNNFLVDEEWRPQTKGMSLQTSTLFVLLSIVLVWIHKPKRLMGHVVDFAVFVLCLLSLVIGAGRLFTAAAGLPTSVHVPAQTLLCVMLLTYVVVLRRAEYGIFAILVGVGIGGKIVRLACPFALLLPFLLEMLRTGIMERGWLSQPYATALASSLAAIIGFGLILVLAWRIDALEKAIRDLSLRDELTQLYNRRGFYVLAEQALYLAQRSQSQFSVLFIDLDGLKVINDTFGHDAGSAIILEMAKLLRNCFRRSDIIGRIGGDEFVIVADASEMSIYLAAQRLEEATARWNATSGRPYKLSYSYGHITTDGKKRETLEELLDMADSAMYRTKRRKKQLAGGVSEDEATAAEAGPQV